MVLLGIDPGCRYAGFAVVAKQNNTVYVIEYGCLTLSPSKPLTERVAIFYDFFAEKISLHKITDLALETPFLGKNAQNFLKLGYLRGALYILVHKHTLHMHEFSPREIKEQVTGFGGASKDQVARVITRLFPRINPNFEREDISDALAVSLCGIWQKRKVAECRI